MDPYNNSNSTAEPDDVSVYSQLGSFALSEVFKDLGLDLETESLSTVESQLGAAPGASSARVQGLGKDSVYGGRFVDDDDDDEYDEEEDEEEEEVGEQEEDEDEEDEDEEHEGEQGEGLFGDDDDEDEDEEDDEEERLRKQRKRQEEEEANDGIDRRDELEKQVDQEMYDETHPDSITITTPAITATTKPTLVRGEEDDFDEDDDDDEAEQKVAQPTAPVDLESNFASKDNMNVDQPVSTGAAPNESILTRVKPEPDDSNATASLLSRLGPPPPKSSELLITTTTPGMPSTTIEVPTSTTAAAKSAMEVEVEPIAPPTAVRRVDDVNDLFPTFEYGKTLDFTDLFSSRPRKKMKQPSEPIKIQLPPEHEITKAKSTKEVLVEPLKPLAPESKLKELLRASQYREKEDWEDEGDSEEELLKAIEKSNRITKSMWVIPESHNAFDNAELDDWEQKIIWGPENQPPTSYASDPLAPRNIDFDRGDWTRSIIWDASKPYKPFTHLNLNLNDRQMLLEVQSTTNNLQSAATQTIDPSLKAGIVVEREVGLDPFNMSNDREYAVTKDAKQKIRQTFGSLEVQHAHPAAKLQLPFYKTRMTKNDMRSFHRPALQFPQGVPLSFEKSRSSKKKKDASGKKVKGNELRHMQDITLKDTAPFILWEYSEETPPIISNVGMGSIIVNYYRKREANDKFVPNLDLGEPLILEGTDESPFKAFGYVHPGQTVPTLYNNLIRAPLFRHRPPTTDFLVCRVTIDGETKYYIRDIKNMFVIGQTYPLTEVPGPHSRKVTTLVKNRLQNITFKLIEKETHHRIKVNRLTRYFPDQNDLQMRQRLKEFMEFNRKGPNQGFWMIKKTVPIPDDAEMMKAATPEMVCLAESMQVGLRHLQDAGYGAAAEEGGAGDDDSKLDIEQQLAPWITTKNFMNATANKAMLKLHGEGDPTGRGEAFSFLRTSMKDIFLRAGELMEDRLAQMEQRPKSAHRYNVQEQQDVYKEEIARIWKAQWDSLRNPIEPELTAADEERARGQAAAAAANERLAKARQRQERHGTIDHGTPGPGTPGGPGGGGSRASSPAESIATGAGGSQAKTLRIKRLIDGKWETEIVRDPTIIAAYVRQRKTIDEDKTDADDLLPSDDEGKNERARKRLKEQLEKLKRNQERRLARKSDKLGVPVSAIGIGGKSYVKTETTRICSNCGQRGHMKTSKKLCPRWHEFNAPKGPESSTTLSSGFGGGLALPALGGAGAATTSAPAPKPAGPKGSNLGKAGSPPPLNSAAGRAASPLGGTPKPTLKFKLGGGGGARSPPASSPPPYGSGDVEHF